MVSYVVNICEQTTNVFYSAFLESLFFFPKSCLNVGGAAYTQVRLIHECLPYSVASFQSVSYSLNHLACSLHLLNVTVPSGTCNNRDVSTIRISTAITNRNENAATKHTVVSPNSATAKQQLTTNTTDSNINKLRLKFKHAVFCSPVPTDGVNVNDRAFAGTRDYNNKTTIGNVWRNGGNTTPQSA